MPRTVIHGEFYASNVLVAEGPAGTRVAPVDWELAAVAPGAVDLAALVSGDWPEADREEIVAAYRSAVAPADLSRARPRPRPPAPRGPVAGMGAAGLGAPEGQRHDWLAEASSWPRGWASEMAAERSLIVNADDFGLSAAVNAGILEAHERGIVTSTSIMVRKPAAGEAAAPRRPAPLARDRPPPRPRPVGLRGTAVEVAYEHCPPDDAAAVERECREQLEAFRGSWAANRPTSIPPAHPHERAGASVAARIPPSWVPLRGRRSATRADSTGRAGGGTLSGGDNRPPA